MIVSDFFKNGAVAEFEEDGLVTAVHSHPAIEIIYANNGKFIIDIDGASDRVNFSIIPPNTPHMLDSSGTKCTIIIIDQGLVDTNILHSELTEVVLSKKATLQDRIQAVRDILSALQPRKYQDERVEQVILLILAYKGEGNLTRKFLADSIHLSEGRLSHLFKNEIGTSLQRYITWHKMKLAVKQLIDNKKSLTESAYASGFYDMPEFSKRFKNMSGVSPSAVYNKSTKVQDAF